MTESTSKKQQQRKWYNDLKQAHYGNDVATYIMRLIEDSPNNLNDFEFVDAAITVLCHAHDYFMVLEYNESEMLKIRELHKFLRNTMVILLAEDNVNLTQGTDGL